MNSGMHEFLAQDRVIWGKPAAQAVLEEADRRGAKRVFIVTSRTLNRTTGAVEKIRDALGGRCAGTFDECREHTPRTSVIAAAEAARSADPDLVLTFGGGTAIDTVKVMLIALAHGVTKSEQLGDYHLRVNPDGSRHTPAVKPPPFRQIVLSTTLSAAEFSDFGGCTDPVRKVKDGYAGKQIGAAAVILDPEVTVHTPEWLWLSTAIRAVDHAVEGICSIQSSPLIEATSLHALRLFGRSLKQTKTDPRDMAARLECLQAAWLSGFGILRVPYGASHGLGHSLGAVTGMSHGYTSCIMLPHVMRWNSDVTRDAQARIAEALGRSDVDAPRAVADLVAGLGLPTRLRDLGVEQSQFDQIARGAAENLWVKTNPRPVNDPIDLVRLLETAW
ncbi:MAG: iron-containing alcohol dehydrogenase [Betaproteobacteria bacterium]|nr:iron-containing alcohol dehydrogenase [Betaproteobacteria bacterium]